MIAIVDSEGSLVFYWHSWVYDLESGWHVIVGHTRMAMEDVFDV